MEQKRKRVVLTINQKLNIIKKLEQGGSTRNLALQYGIGETTVRDLRKNKYKLINYASNSDSPSGLSSRKTMKLSTYDELDKAMLQWYNQQRAQNIPVSGIICAKQAKLYFDALGMEGDFNASSGWLTRFKQRHGIREISIHGEKLNNNESAANEFRNYFQEFIEEKQVTPEQVYNADETGLNWKCLPTKTLAHKSESRAPGHKSSKERITALCCANATGSHKIKLAVIGEAKKPRCFKGTESTNMPVTYFNQKKAWIDPTIFKTWFHHNFVPQVREHLRSKGLPEKAILLLDNAPSHPNEAVLQSADGKIITCYLPLNITALIQPMDQGVISAMKRLYRGRLLQKLVEEGNDLKTFSKTVSLLDAIYEVAHAWDSIKPSTISQSWEQIFPDIETVDCNSFDEEEISTSELAAILQSTEGGVEVDSENILEWFEVDCDDLGYEVMSDSEIVKRVQGQTTDSDESEDEDMELIPETRISNSSALQWTEGLLQFLEQQSDSLLFDKLVLRRLRASIRKKEAMSLKHKSIKDCFS